jgi:hypothetical protein
MPIVTPATKLRLPRKAKLDGSGLFLALCKSAKIPAPEREHRFHPPRRWRFDYAWIAHNLALEVEGGVWIQGRHSRGAGMIADMSKYNQATLDGWRILRVTPQQLCTTDTLAMIQEAMQREAA